MRYILTGRPERFNAEPIAPFVPLKNRIQRLESGMFPRLRQLRPARTVTIRNVESVGVPGLWKKTLGQAGRSGRTCACHATRQVSIQPRFFCAAIWNFEAFCVLTCGLSTAEKTKAPG
jgi:hypothetical protein